MHRMDGATSSQASVMFDVNGVNDICRIKDGIF